MADVITVLERMGRDVRVRMGGLEQMMSEAAVAADVRAALRGAEHRRLEELLGARMDMFCGQHPAREDDDEESDAPPDDDGEEEEDAPKQARLASHAAVTT